MNKKLALPVLAISAVAVIGLPGAMSSQEVTKVMPALDAPNPDPIVGIAKGDDYEATTVKAIERAGGLSGIVKKGSTVFIKPNIVGPSPSGAGRITDWRVVQAVVNAARKAGAAKVIVGEGPVDDSWKACFEIAGYFNIKNAELMDTSVPKDQCYYVTPEFAFAGKPLYIAKAYFDADTVISVSVMKTHSEAGVTMSLKNVGIGMPSFKAMASTAAWKVPLHNLGIYRVIPDVNQMRRPEFNIIDAMVAGEGDGPVNPTPKKMNLVIASKDPVAADTIGTTIMGYQPTQITHLVYSAAVNAGVMDMDRIKVVGEDVKSVASTFKKPPHPTRWAYKETGITNPKAIDVDGDLKDWTGVWVNSIRRENQVKNGRDAWNGNSDLSGNVMVAYDAKNLYISAKVKDDIFIPAPSGKFNSIDEPKGDAIEFSLSAKNAFETGNPRTQFRDGRDFVFSVGATGKESAVYLKGKGDDGEVFPKASAITSKISDGFVVEVSLPLDAISLSGIKHGVEAYMDFSLVDVDDDNTTSRMFWAGSKSSYTNPVNMGRIMAVDMGKEK